MTNEREIGGLPEGLTSDIRTLIEMMARGGIAELRLDTGAVKLRLQSHPVQVTTGGTVAIASGEGEDSLPAMEGVLITAPMIGTFYRAPAPGEPNFVDPGDQVESGQTIGIIEAMKIMNEIPAEEGGIVEEFLAANGQPVEYGQPLLRLRPLPQEA